MSGRVTYRIEERDADGAVLQTWMRGAVDRAEVLHLFDVLWRADEQVGWALYRRGSRRLVVVAAPASSAPVNAEASADLDEALRALVPDAGVERRLRLIKTQGWVYPREEEPAGPAPLPAGVVGYAVGGRR